MISVLMEINPKKAALFRRAREKTIKAQESRRSFDKLYGKYKRFEKDLGYRQPIIPKESLPKQVHKRMSNLAQKELEAKEGMRSLRRKLGIK